MNYSRVFVLPIQGSHTQHQSKQSFVVSVKDQQDTAYVHLSKRTQSWCEGLALVNSTTRRVLQPLV